MQNVCLDAQSDNVADVSSFTVVHCLCEIKLGLVELSRKTGVKPFEHYKFEASLSNVGGWTLLI